MKSLIPAIAALTLLLATSAALADSTEATCNYTPKGEAEAPKQDCTFSQAQGYVTIELADGKVFDFSPTDAGDYTDADGAPVIRNLDMGDAGIVWELEDGVVTVWW